MEPLESRIANSIDTAVRHRRGKRTNLIARISQVFYRGARVMSVRLNYFR